MVYICWINVVNEDKISSKCMCIHVYMYAAFSVCEFGLNDCDVNATCIDRDGGFDCQCITGYSGNGAHCDGKSITFITNWNGY